MIDGVLRCRTTPDGEWRPVNLPVAWCRSSEFNDAQAKRQSFSGWREHHDDCDIALYAAPVARPDSLHASAAMTDQHQHRATPEQWEHLENGAQLERPYNSALCLLELRDRITALEATQHAHVDTSRLSDAEREQMAQDLASPAAWRPLVDTSRLSDAEREQMAQDLASPAAWRPLNVETTYADAKSVAEQILRAPTVVRGTLKHGGKMYQFTSQANQSRGATEKVPTIGQEPNSPERPQTFNFTCRELDLAQIGDFGEDRPWNFNFTGGPGPEEMTEFLRQCKSAPENATPTTPEPRPTNPPAGWASALAGRVRRVIGDDAPCSHSNARAAIREVAQAALQMHPDKNLTWERVALWLEQEANQ
jgi:hypothetical protein